MCLKFLSLLSTINSSVPQIRSPNIDTLPETTALKIIISLAQFLQVMWGTLLYSCLMLSLSLTIKDPFKLSDVNFFLSLLEAYLIKNSFYSDTELVSPNF